MSELLLTQWSAFGMKMLSILFTLSVPGIFFTSFALGKGQQVVTTKESVEKAKDDCIALAIKKLEKFSDFDRASSRFKNTRQKKDFARLESIGNEISAIDQQMHAHCTQSAYDLRNARLETKEMYEKRLRTSEDHRCIVEAKTNGILVGSTGVNLGKANPGGGYDSTQAMSLGDDYIVARAFACVNRQVTFDFQGHSYSVKTGKRIK